MSVRKWLMTFGALLLLLVVGGGGSYYYKMTRDPLLRAQQFLAQGNLRSAQVELRNAVRSSPNTADVHLRMASLQMKLADPAAAEKEFRAAITYGADRSAVLPLLGEALIAQSRYREVLTTVPARSSTPDNTAKSLLLRAAAQVGLNDVPSAVATLAEAERAVPGHVEVPLIAARIAAAHNDLALTQAKVDEVLRIDPNQIDALLMKEQLLTAANDRPAALAVADRAVQSAPWSAMARLDRANQLLFAGQDAKAKADVDAVLDVQPRFVDAIYLRAVLIARQGRYADAAVELAKLDTAVTRFPQALYYQGLIAANLGQIQSAAEFAHRYNTLVPADPDGKKLVARTELAANRPEVALPILEAAVVAGQTDADTLDLLGRTYIALGRSPAAAEAFAKAVALSPDDPSLLSHLGLAQLQSGNPTEAETALSRSFTIAPSMTSAGEALVAAALGTGDVEKADAALIRLRSVAGETEAVGVLTGMVKLARNDLEGARIAFANTAKAFPNSVGPKLDTARVMVMQGRRAAGLAMLADLLAKDPANMPVLNTYLPLLSQDNQTLPAVQALEAARKADPKQMAFPAMLADAYVKSDNPQRAITLLQGLRTNDGLPPALLAPLARAQAAAGAVDDAKASFRELLKAEPGNLIARSAQVNLLLKDKEFDAAEAGLREALVAVPGNLRVMSTIVSVEFAARGLDAALKVADELRQQPANLPAAVVLRGDMLQRASRPTEAAAAYRAELETAETAPLLLRMAASLSSAGHDDQASDALRAWLKSHPDTPEAAQMLGQLDMKARRFADAQLHLDMVLAKRPDDALALNNLAWTYQQVGDARARSMAQRAYLQAPTPDAADTLGWIMVQDKAAKAAIPLLSRATTQRPNDLSMRYHLAVALNDDGQKPEAVAVLRQLVGPVPPFEEQAAAKALLAELSR